MATVAHWNRTRRFGASVIEAPRLRLVLLATLVLIGVGLFARIMAFPLQHDEQMYLPVGVLYGTADLYADLGFNHFPTLPLLLNHVFSVFSTEHFLLTGRLVIFVAWIAAGTALILIARRFANPDAMMGFSVLLLATNPVLTGAAGTLVSNNFLPIPFSLFGLHLFLRETGRQKPQPAWLVLSGVCLGIAIGLKANYAFLVPPFACAAILLPRQLPIGQRIRVTVLPFLAGGLIGGLPVIYHLATDFEGFITHTVRYHTGPHLAYWQANSDLDGPKVIGLLAKAQLAYTLWLTGSSLLIPLSIAFLVAVLSCSRGKGALRHVLDGPTLLVAGLAALGILISFVPTPAFPQYFAPPIAFGIVLVILLFGKLDADERATFRPFLYASGLIAALAGAPVLAMDLPKLVTPRSWTGISIHHQSERLSYEVRKRGGGAVATLAPVYAVEAGLPIYPELAGGPFIYRVADYLLERDRRHYRRLASPRTLAARLDATPPAGILIGLEGDLDRALHDYAVARGYERVTTPIDTNQYGAATLYVRPGRLTSAASPRPLTSAHPHH